MILLTILILKCLPRFTGQMNITITLARPRCFVSLISYTQFSAVVAGFRHFKMFECFFCGNCFYSFSIRKTDNNRGFPSSPDLSALDQYRTSGSPSVRYLKSRFDKSGDNEKPCNNLYMSSSIALFRVPYTISFNPF